MTRHADAQRARAAAPPVRRRNLALNPLRRLGDRLVAGRSIGGKLNLGFGTLVGLILLVIALAYLASWRASQRIDRTNDARAPAARVAAEAEANLLRMIADVQEYLATADRTSRLQFDTDRVEFEDDLRELNELIGDDADPGGVDNTADESRLAVLQTAYADWSAYPARLFTLRDDPHQREPAFRILMEDANPLIVEILAETNGIAATQLNREPNAQNLALFGDMSAFQSSFIAMVSGLRGYVTTGDRDFKFEYSSNLTANQAAWTKLNRDPSGLEAGQQSRLESIRDAREAFLLMPDEMFSLVEGEHAREDLYLFRNEVIPASDGMLGVLRDLNHSQQSLLAADLNAGSRGLAGARWQTLAAGVIALASALLLAIIVRDNIAGPIRRLTAVAERIGRGDRRARADAESDDEIGVLATTFNRMTDQLETTLQERDLRQEALEALNTTQQQQNAYLAALHDTSIGLISRLEIDELLEAIITRAASLIGTTHGYIMLADVAGAPASGSDTMQLRVGIGLFDSLIATRIHQGEGLAGTVWASGEPLVITAYDEFPDRFSHIPVGRIGATVGVPLKEYVGGTVAEPRTVGVLGVALEPGSSRPCGEAEVELLSRFGQLASMAIDNARLFTAAKEARTNAEAADQSKGVFLATMSHEIRTPMNAVIGMSELLIGTELSDEQHEYAEIIQSSGEALLTVINDILDFSKIEAGKLDLEEAPLDIRSCIESALDVVALRAASKGIDLAAIFDDELPRLVIGDATRIRQIVINLLTNGVKFTERGEVVVTAGVEATLPRDPPVHVLRVTVADTGIGIPADRIERLFQSFSQVDASTTRKYGGTGLGLAICLRLVEQMGGQIGLESEEGRGTTVRFTLQLRGTGDPLPGAASDERRLAGCRLLAVDSGRTSLDLISTYTHSWAMLPRTTTSPQEALEWLQRGDPFDVAIIDEMSGGIDGAPLQEVLRRLPGRESLPVVVYHPLGHSVGHANNGEHMVRVAKPVKPAQLLNALLELLAASEGPAATDATLLPTPTASTTAVRILVAEDNPLNQKLMLRMLDKMGHSADVVANGLEALAALEQNRYDVILIDVQMPEMDGWEATREIHRRWPNERPRIVAVTANAMAGDAEKCFEAGMDDYVSKPIRSEDLKRVLGTVPAGG